MLGLTKGHCFLYTDSKATVPDSSNGKAFASEAGGRRFKTWLRPGIFLAILGRGPRAFQIVKISAVNH